jgi:multiple sugar transport system permease protein
MISRAKFGTKTSSFLCNISMLAILIILIFPLYWLLATSFKPQTDFFIYPPHFYPHSFTLEHYRTLLKETAFLTWVKNSLIVASVTTAFVVIVASIAAYSLTRFRYPGRTLIARLVLLIYMFPPILLVIPFYIILVRLNLNDSLMSLTFSYTAYSLPFSLWLLWEYFKTIPVDLEEAARIDGATRFQSFFKIVVPLATPGIIATAIFGFIWAWVEYLYAMVLISSQSNKTLTLGLSHLLTTDVKLRWDLMTSASVLMTLPVMILFALFQRQLIMGFTTGAVKE